MPLSLNDDEYNAVQAAAAPIHPLQRDAFLKALAVELERHPVVGPGLVHRVAAELQKTFGVVAHSETLLAPRRGRARWGAEPGPRPPSPPAGVRSWPFSSMDRTAQEDVDAETNSLMVYITPFPLFLLRLTTRFRDVNGSPFFVGGASCGGTLARISWRATPRRSDCLGFWLLTSSDVLGAWRPRRTDGFNPERGFPRRENAVTRTLRWSDVRMVPARICDTSTSSRAAITERNMRGNT